MTYSPGDHWKICDECGFRYRASQTRKRWDNLIVCNADFEERHPQDFVRGRKDRQNVPDPRPELVDTFLGPLITVTSAAAVAGATTLSVESSTRFGAGDHVRITLEDGRVHPAILQSVPSSTSIQLTASTAVPSSVASGANVANYSAVSAASIE